MYQSHIDVTYDTDALQLEGPVFDRVDTWFFNSKIIVVLREIFTLKHENNKALNTDTLKWF